MLRPVFRSDRNTYILAHSPQLQTLPPHLYCCHMTPKLYWIGQKIETHKDHHQRHSKLPHNTELSCFLCPLIFLQFSFLLLLWYSLALLLAKWHGIWMIIEMGLLYITTIQRDMYSHREMLTISANLLSLSLFQFFADLSQRLTTTFTRQPRIYP